jgi:Uma2 family endonuclease
MVAIRKQPFITPEAYLKQEREATVKSEYIDGQIYAMSGASRQHNRITIDVATLINVQLRGGPCELFANDMCVKVNDSSLYTYPDVVVVCGEAQFEDTALDTLLNPTLIIEVLSDSTEKYDRGKKFAHYQRIEALREYVLLSQDEARVECYTRQAGNRWILSTVISREDTMPLESIGCVLPLADVYARVQFSPEGDAEAGEAAQADGDALKS